MLRVRYIVDLPQIPMNHEQIAIAQAKQQAAGQLQMARERRAKIESQIPKYQGWVRSLMQAVPPVDWAATVSVPEVALFTMLTVYADHLSDQLLGLTEELAKIDAFIAAVTSPISKVRLG